MPDDPSLIRRPAPNFESGENGRHTALCGRLESGSTPDTDDKSVWY